jgi:hypothetical protein
METAQRRFLLTSAPQRDSDETRFLIPETSIHGLFTFVETFRSEARFQGAPVATYTSRASGERVKEYPSERFNNDVGDRERQTLFLKDFSFAA